VTRMEARVLEDVVRLSGSVRASDWAAVKSRVAETVSEVLVREGQAVRRGEVLARFETVALQARLAEKESNLEAERARLRLAASTLEKNRTLAARSIVSQTALDEAEAEWRARQAGVAALEAQMVLARRALADAVVLAPIGGIVAEREVNPGETLPSDAAMFTLMDLSRVEVEASVPAGEAARLEPGQPVRLRIEGFGDRIFQGAVARIGPTTLSGSRSIPIYVELDNAQGLLRGGLFAVGEAVAARAEAAIALPPVAIRRDGEGTHVLKLSEGRLLRQGVEVVREWSHGDLVQVAGLEEGDLVVSANLPGLAAGTAARLADDGV
jgi:multidrug efflux system membrane fusion protein